MENTGIRKVQITADISAYLRSGNKFDEFILREIWVQNHYKVNEDIIGKKNKWMTVIDIGAHIGLFSLFMAKIKEKCQIYSYEAASDNYKLLKRNIELNKYEDRIHPFNFAVYSKKEKYAYIDRTWGESSNTGGRAVQSRQQADQDKVKTITLEKIFSDNRIKHCDLLKIDCEGAEYEIILDTPREILDRIGVITGELHFLAVNETLLGRFIKHLRGSFDYVDITPPMGSILPSIFCSRKKRAFRGLNNLNAHERKFYSQNGEDGMLGAIFDQIGATNKYYVEFGVSSYTQNNGLFLRLHRGWQGLMMDSGGSVFGFVKQEYINKANINEIFRKYHVPAEPDLLIINLDGNDYWIWKSLKRYRPRVIVIEYNASLPVDENKVIPYDPAFRWDGTDYFGASLLALEKLAGQKGYTLVGCDSNGVNAFYVRNDLVKGNFTKQTLRTLFRPPRYGVNGKGHPRSPKSEKGYIRDIL